MKHKWKGLALGLLAGLTITASAAWADSALAPMNTVPYSRYNHDYLKKKYPYYPSNIQWEKTDPPIPFTAPSIFTCAGCHPKQYEEWRGSMHAQAFRDPLYLGELKLAVDAVGKEITRQCEGCHTPAAVVQGEMDGEFDFAKLSDLAKAGVSCDVCHSIKRHTHWETPSNEPENASYVLSPGRIDDKGNKILTKYGPYPNYEGCGGGFHECVESPLHKQAELCAGCHQVFHYKEHTPIEHTYAEWKKSMYAINGIQCQDCHMVDIETFKRSADTFQKPQRGEYRHYFNGANFVMYFLEEVKAKKEGDEKMAANARHKYEMAVARLQAAAEIDVDPIYDSKGNLSKIRVRVHNKRAGHALPTSLTNIREMWLEVVVTDAQGKEVLRSGFVNEEGMLDENTYVFNSDGMGHDMSFKVDPWDVVAFSRHDVIPPKGYRDVYYTALAPKETPTLNFHVKLRFRQGNQKVVHKLLTNMPKGFDLTEIYGLTEVPTVPVVDMIDKTVTLSTKGSPSKSSVQKKAEVPGKEFHDKLGGEAGIKKAVDLFYDKVLADSRVNYFFEGIDMATQRRMQASFMNFAISGSLPYAGRDMKAAHAHLVSEKGLNDTHFDIIIEHFGAALKELGVPDNLIASAAAVAESVREDVLGRR